MKDKTFEKYKASKFGDRLARESARERYKRLNKEKRKESAVQGQDLVDIKIRQAMQDGAFDGLPGKGKPLDLDKYYEVPEHLRLAYSFFKNSGFVPEEVRLKKEMAMLKEKIKACKSEHKRLELQKKMNELSQQYNHHMEYNKGLKKSF